MSRNTRKYYEESLPEGYHQIYQIDVNDKKLLIVLNIVTLLALVLIVGTGIALIGWKECGRSMLTEAGILWSVLLAVGSILYIILHELVHGAVYYAFTGVKPSFGISTSVAFCGLPDIYVYRKASLAAVCAPLIVFTILFGIGIGLCSTAAYKLLFVILMGVHIGGCSGDIYNTWMYLFRFKDKAILTRDTGPVQRFYKRSKDM